ncbi:MAG: hypothetical protein KH828_01090 [Clostridiales bacterium]|nr:hypothetical protein [Clostridiales bacterium]
MNRGIEELFGRHIDYINIMGVPVGLLCWLPIPFFAVFFMKSDCEKKKELQVILFLNALSFCSFIFGSVLSKIGIYDSLQNTAPVYDMKQMFTTTPSLAKLISIMCYGIPTVFACVSLLLVWKKLGRWRFACVLLLMFLFANVVVWDIAWMSVIAGTYFLCAVYLEKERGHKEKSTVFPMFLAGMGTLVICFVFCFFYSSEIYYQKGYHMFFEEGDINGIEYLEKAAEMDPDNMIYLLDYEIALRQNGEDELADECRKQLWKIENEIKKKFESGGR